jgi:hypothetical protein
VSFSIVSVLFFFSFYNWTPYSLENKELLKDLGYKPWKIFEWRSRATRLIQLIAAGKRISIDSWLI